MCVTSQCSVTCGVGQQQREVYCASEQDLAVMPNSLCEKISKPETLRKCNMQECKTNAGLYAKVQSVRSFTINTRTIFSDIAERFCFHSWLKSLKINLTLHIICTAVCHGIYLFYRFYYLFIFTNLAVLSHAGPVCRKNTMSSRFCDKLKLLGRCSLRSVQRQCCVTCGS